MADNVTRIPPAGDGTHEMTTVEAQLRREMHGYATAVRQFAYAVPNGVGEQALLQLSEHMAATATSLPARRRAMTSGRW